MPHDRHISPRFTTAKLAAGRVEDKIDVFEDQITGWLIQHARALCAKAYPARTTAGFAALAIVGSYFETIESYARGKESKGHSRVFFRAGFLKVFTDLRPELAKLLPGKDVADSVVDAVYEQLRCGLFHEGSAKYRVMLRDDTAPVGFMLHKVEGTVGSIVIDPAKFVEAISIHFRHYVAELRRTENADQRRSFEAFFDLRTKAGAVVLPPEVSA